MLTKILKYLCGKNYYKMAVIIISLNFLFELVFKYRFESKIEVFYFIIAVIICTVSYTHLDVYKRQGLGETEAENY